MMVDHLYCKDLYEPILQASKPSEVKNMTAAYWEILNHKVVGTIHKYMDKSLLENVSNFINVYKVCTKLEYVIQKKSPQTKLIL